MFAPVYYRERLNDLPQIAIDSGDYKIYQATSDFSRRLVELIKSATQRIYISALYIEADEAGEAILRALFEARIARPELEIGVFVDFHRAQRGRIGEAAGMTHLDFFRKMAAEYKTSLPIYGVPINGREVFGVLHLKGFVLDDTVLYSGASINNVYLGWQDRYRYDRYHEIRSPALADCFVDYMRTHFLDKKAVPSFSEGDVASRKVLKQAIRHFRKHMKTAAYSFAPEVVTGKVGLTPVSGLGKRRNPLNRVTRDLIRGAEEKVLICTPYFNLPTPVARDVTQCLKRGVEVTIVVGDKTSNDFYVSPDEPFSKITALPYLYEQNLRAFARKHKNAIEQGLLNLKIWKDGSNTYHLKGVYVDDTWAMVTGSNLNPRAWGLDLENAILVNDQNQQLTDKLLGEWQQILSHTTRINDYHQLEDIKSYPPEVQKLLGQVKKVKAHVLIRKII